MDFERICKVIIKPVCVLKNTSSEGKVSLVGKGANRVPSTREEIEKIISFTGECV